MTPALQRFLSLHPEWRRQVRWQPPQRGGSLRPGRAWPAIILAPRECVLEYADYLLACGLIAPGGPTWGSSATVSGALEGLRDNPDRYEFLDLTNAELLLNVPRDRSGIPTSRTPAPWDCYALADVADVLCQPEPGSEPGAKRAAGAGPCCEGEGPGDE